MEILNSKSRAFAASGRVAALVFLAGGGALFAGEATNRIFAVRAEAAWHRVF
jgi:hypothetical protein